MSRLLEMLATLLVNDRMLGLLDGMLLALGLTATAATVAPLLQTAAVRWTRLRRDGRAPGTRFLPVAVAALALWAPAPAAADAPAQQLRGHVLAALRVLEDPGLQARPAERRAEVRRIAREMFDFAEITKRALGPHWQARTAAERAEMVGLMTVLLERSYLSKIELYSGERVVFAGESVDGDVAGVRSRIVTRQGSEIPVDYRLRRHGDRWMVYDVAIEGVSLVANYRTQFAKIIQTASYPELVRRLRAKVGEPDEAPLKRTSRN